jgi:hypothetical protein
LLAAYVQGKAQVLSSHAWAALRESEFSPWGVKSRWAFLAAPALIALLVTGWSSAELTGQDKEHFSVTTVSPASPENQGITPVMEVDRIVAATSETAEANLIESRLAQSAHWLRQADPKRYTIQVLLSAADEERGLERFLRQEGVGTAIADLYIYRTRLRDQDMHGVIYGDFATPSEARAALENLPDALRRHKPFLRNVSQVLTEWRDLPQESGLSQDKGQMAHATSME